MLGENFIRLEDRWDFYRSREGENAEDAETQLQLIFNTKPENMEAFVAAGREYGVVG